MFFFFFFQAEDGIRDLTVTGVQTCALPISAKPPRPTTDATACRGNMSLTVVNRLADHHWCAPAATATMLTAAHMVPATGANIVGTMASAATSSAVLRPRFTLQPRLISAPETQPPVTEPRSAAT